MSETESVQVARVSHIRERVDKNVLLPPPCQIGDRKEVILSCEDSLNQFQDRALRFPADDPIHTVEVPHDLLVKETGRESSQKDVQCGKSRLDPLHQLHDVVTLVVPVKWNG